MHSCGLGRLLVIPRYPKVGHLKLNRHFPQTCWHFRASRKDHLMGGCYQHVTLRFRCALAAFLHCASTEHPPQGYNAGLFSLHWSCLSSLLYQLLEVTRKSSSHRFSLKGTKVRDQRKTLASNMSWGGFKGLQSNWLHKSQGTTEVGL